MSDGHDPLGVLALDRGARNNAAVQRDLGNHDAKIETLTNEVAALREDVHIIMTTLSEAKGGWRTLMMVAGVAGASGALVGKIAAYLGWIPK